MSLSASVFNKLINLEKSLHRTDVRRDSHKMEAILHTEFFEVGRSGRRYSRAEIIKEFVDSPSLPEIVSSDFTVDEIQPGIWLLCYLSAHVDAGGKQVRQSTRTSIWVTTLHGFQLRFHQGTPKGESHSDK